MAFTNAERRKRYYEKHKVEMNAANARMKDEMRTWLCEQKNVPCMDCGVRYPSYVMDFDHRDPKTKVNTVAKLLNNSSWLKLRAEVLKCDVVCSNCHRVRTAKQMNWFEYESLDGPNQHVVG